MKWQEKSIGLRSYEKSFSAFKSQERIQDTTHHCLHYENWLDSWMSASIGLPCHNRPGDGKLRIVKQRGKGIWVFDFITRHWNNFWVVYFLFSLIKQKHKHLWLKGRFSFTNRKIIWFVLSFHWESYLQTLLWGWERVCNPLTYANWSVFLCFWMRKVMWNKVILWYTVKLMNRTSTKILIF